jgi:hypothetical protein
MAVHRQNVTSPTDMTALPRCGAWEVDEGEETVGVAVSYELTVLTASWRRMRQSIVWGYLSSGETTWPGAYGAKKCYHTMYAGDCKQNISVFIEWKRENIFVSCSTSFDRLCGLVVRVPGYRSRGPGLIPCATRFF